MAGEQRCAPGADPPPPPGLPAFTPHAHTGQLLCPGGRSGHWGFSDETNTVLALGPGRQSEHRHTPGASPHRAPDARLRGGRGGAAPRQGAGHPSVSKQLGGSVPGSLGIARRP